MCNTANGNERRRRKKQRGVGVVSLGVGWGEGQLGRWMGERSRSGLSDRSGALGMCG